MDARLVLLLSVVVTLVSAASKIPKCNDDHINKIKTYWTSNGGAPRDIVKSKDIFHVVSGTNSPVAGDGKCKHFSFTAPSGNNKGYTMNGIESNGHFPVVESSGVLKITVGQETFTNYIISFGKGLLCAYKCSPDGPVTSATVSPDVTISSTPSAKPEDLTALTTAVNGMGFAVASFSCK